MHKKIIEFFQETAKNIKNQGKDKEFRELTGKWLVRSARYKYSYNFTWLGRPIIQYPQDIAALQEIIWSTKPDLIIETGIAHGGSIIFYASMLELLGGTGMVVGVDIDIRRHNRAEIERHPMKKRIKMIEGSSIDSDVISKIEKTAFNRKKVLVVLDSNHTHAHVLDELKLYSRFVTKGSYLIVMDTVIEEMPNKLFSDRPWGKNNNPSTAVKEFLVSNDRFVLDRSIENKLLITVAGNGYLKCVKS